MLRHQFATLLIAIGTLALTIYLFYVIPKGFFPVQDTGVILGVSEAPQDIAFDKMKEKQQDLARVILHDEPAVESLSSFIGVDGTNTTVNSGRIHGSSINRSRVDRSRLRHDRVGVGLEEVDREIVGVVDVRRRVREETDALSGRHLPLGGGALQPAPEVDDALDAHRPIFAG